MKKTFIKLITFVIAVAMICTSFAACSSNAERVAEDETGTGKNYVSLAMYSLITSLMKGNLAYYITSEFGSYNSPDFWMTVVDGTSPQKTYKEYYTYIVDEKVKYFVASLNLFDELGLSLSDAEIAAVDKEMDEYVQNDGDGSVSVLNSILSRYGANYDTLRDYKIMNAKTNKLTQYLYYRDNGEIKVDDATQRKYFEENYIAFKQILIPTFYYVYDTDKYGDNVYYLVDSEGKFVSGAVIDNVKHYKVAYDTKNGQTLSSIGIDGSEQYPERDVNGDEIYYVYNAEEPSKIHIAYDTVKGKPAPVDKDGDKSQDVADYSDEKKAELEAKAEALLKELEEGDYSAFEKAMVEYDTNYSNDGGATGEEIYFLAAEKSYGDALDNIKSKLSKIGNGEIVLCKSTNGLHILMRYDIASEIDKTDEYGTKLYSDFGEFRKEYTDWFDDDTGRFDFDTDIVNMLLVARLEPYTEKIVINEEKKGSVDISTINPNYFYS